MFKEPRNWFHQATLALTGGMAMNRLFRFFHKSVRHRSLTPPIEPSRFLLRIRGEIRNRKSTPPYQWYWESPTPRISESGESAIEFLDKTLRICDAESRQLPSSVIWGVDDSAYRGVDDSPYQWVGESLSDKKFYNGQCQRYWNEAKQMLIQEL